MLLPDFITQIFQRRKCFWPMQKLKQLSSAQQNATGHQPKAKASVEYLWEWAIASHGRVLIPLGWLQVTCVGHCSICQSKIFLAHRGCSIRSENLINCGTDLSKDLAVSG